VAIGADDETGRRPHALAHLRPAPAGADDVGATRGLDLHDAWADLLRRSLDGLLAQVLQVSRRLLGDCGRDESKEGGENCRRERISERHGNRILGSAPRNFVRSLVPYKLLVPGLLVPKLRLGTHVRETLFPVDA